MAAVAVLHRAPGVALRMMVVAGAAVEESMKVRQIDLAGLVGVHRDIVGAVEVRARHIADVGGIGLVEVVAKVPHMAAAEDIDLGEAPHKIADMEDLEEGHYRAADVVAGNPGVVDSSPETGHNPGEAQEEHRVVADTPAAGIDRVGAADSPAEESLGHCEHWRAVATL